MRSAFSTTDSKRLLSYLHTLFSWYLPQREDPFLFLLCPQCVAKYSVLTIFIKYLLSWCNDLEWLLIHSKLDFFPGWLSPKLDRQTDKTQTQRMKVNAFREERVASWHIYQYLIRRAKWEILNCMMQFHHHYRKYPQQRKDSHPDYEGTWARMSHVREGLDAPITGQPALQKQVESP